MRLFIDDGARGTPQQTRNRADQLQFLSQDPFGAMRQAIPILGESAGVGGACTERGYEIVKRIDAREFFGGQTDHLAEAGVHRANFLPRSEKDHSFLEPFNNIQHLGNAVLRGSPLATIGLLLEGCKNFLMTQLQLGDLLATLQLQQRRNSQRSAKFQSFQCNQRGRASTNARDQRSERFTSGLQREGNHPRDFSLGRRNPGFATSDVMGLKCPAPDAAQLLTFERTNPGSGAALPSKAHALRRWVKRTLPCLR